ncbi:MULTISPECIES: transcriptional regulator [unclassified Streptomyces]|uniref:transcriptional regulator n=1 Tax=unclassified Streptomyces TaxID=2593676 RepID=UPI000C28020A|nr:transcriptional regulator [Streptomyces sp. CB02959]PJN41117.1 transcriptional regulator [Streptomyces sp. CB02959]
MYDRAAREHALALVAQGRSLNSVSKQTAISRHAIRSWQHRIQPLSRTTACTRCEREPRPPDATAPYAYLLGLYLGDGCISRQPRGGYALRIACADAWPGLIAACRAAVRAVRPMNSVCVAQKAGCVMVTSYSRHWPCLFPQHGPGKKHERRIILEPWQQQIVDDHPWEFLRGLIHSDGCRMTNWTTRVVGGERKRYEYPRYFFTNMSADILRLYTETLDKVGVEWKPARQSRKAENISVARRASVALMDKHIGPKY